MRPYSRLGAESRGVKLRRLFTLIGATTIDPDLLTAAERLQYEGHLRRDEANTIVMSLAGTGTAIKEIVRRTGLSRGTVRQIMRGNRHEVFRVRQSSLDLYLPRLEALWSSGCRNGAELWRRLQAEGFRGSLRVIGEWATRRRRAELASDQQLQRVPSARTIAGMMTTSRDHLSRSDTITVAAIEAERPTLVAARDGIDGFHTMIRRKSVGELRPWLRAAHGGLIASFANGIAKDEGGRLCGHQIAMVERPNGRTSDKAEAGQTPDVRPREDRSATSSSDWRHLGYH